MAYQLFTIEDKAPRVRSWRRVSDATQARIELAYLKAIGARAVALPLR